MPISRTAPAIIVAAAIAAATPTAAHAGVDTTQHARRAVAMRATTMQMHHRARLVAHAARKARAI